MTSQFPSKKLNNIYIIKAKDRSFAYKYGCVSLQGKRSFCLCDFLEFLGIGKWNLSLELWCGLFGWCYIPRFSIFLFVLFREAIYLASLSSGSCCLGFREFFFRLIICSDNITWIFREVMDTFFINRLKLFFTIFYSIHISWK